MIKTLKQHRMNFEEANELLSQEKNVRLPEWRGYWFKNEKGLIKALTKDGDIKDAWASAYHDRLDWEIAEGLDFGWALTAMKAGKTVTRESWKGIRVRIIDGRISIDVDLGENPHLDLSESWESEFGIQIAVAEDWILVS